MLKLSRSCGISHFHIIKALLKRRKKSKTRNKKKQTKTLVIQKPCGYRCVYNSILFWIKNMLLKQAFCLYTMLCFTLQSGFGIYKLISLCMKLKTSIRTYSPTANAYLLYRTRLPEVVFLPPFLPKHVVCISYFQHHQFCSIELILVCHATSLYSIYVDSVQSLSS